MNHSTQFISLIRKRPVIPAPNICTSYIELERGCLKWQSKAGGTAGDHSRPDKEKWSFFVFYRRREDKKWVLNQQF